MNKFNGTFQAPILLGYKKFELNHTIAASAENLNQVSLFVIHDYKYTGSFITK